jgi:hypothetical protein
VRANRVQGLACRFGTVRTEDQRTNIAGVDERRVNEINHDGGQGIVVEEHRYVLDYRPVMAEPTAARRIEYVHGLRRDRRSVGTASPTWNRLGREV